MSKRVLSIATALAIAGSVLAAGPATADTEMFPHPANVHDGSCLDVGAVVAPLGDVSSQLLVDGVATVTEPVDPPEFTIPVEASVTTIPIAYADLLAAPHSIVVRQSADELNGLAPVRRHRGPRDGSGGRGLRSRPDRRLGLHGHRDAARQR